MAKQVKIIQAKDDKGGFRDPKDVASEIEQAQKDGWKLLDFGIRMIGAFTMEREAPDSTSLDSNEQSLAAEAGAKGNVGNTPGL